MHLEITSSKQKHSAYDLASSLQECSFVVKKFDSSYQTFEFHTFSLSEHYSLDWLESRSLLIDRPRYNFQESLWKAYSYILKSKIEQHYFDEKVLVIAEERKVFEIPVQKILNSAYWVQLTTLKNFGTIDEGTSLYGTVYLKKIKNFFEDQLEEKSTTGIKLFDRLNHEIKDCILKDIGIEKLKDVRTKNRVIEDMIKQKFPELTSIFLRELVSLVRKDLR